MNSNAMRSECVIAKVVGGFYIILIVVGPIQIDLFAVVWNGVFLPFGIAAF